MCILDFYVDENFQRNGFGYQLFNYFLDDCNISAEMCGYDKPSEKFLNFLNKYYSLRCYIPQNNNFVVFDDYFKNKRGRSSTEFTGDSKRNKNKNMSMDYYNSGVSSKISNDRKLSQNDSPWATYGNNNQNNFISSSSSYGAYYQYNKNKY